jgi:drug/metabolite transporter (DMT)-like permease
MATLLDQLTSMDLPPMTQLPGGLPRARSVLTESEQRSRSMFCRIFFAEPGATSVGKCSSASTPPLRLWLEAIALLIGAVTLFTALDTVAKLLVTRHAIPVTQIVWLRFVGQVCYMLAIAWFLGTRGLFVTRKPGWQLVRSVLMVMTTTCNFIALQTLRLDQTVTITFLAPLVVALLAGPLLGEWVGWRRGVAILVGFGGVVIALQPGSAPLNAAVLVSLTGMVAYALFMLLTRHLSAFDPPFVTLFYSMIVGTVVSTPLAVSTWVQPGDALAWVMLASLGALGGAGHLLFIHAYARAPASTVSPFLYVQLLTMVAAGYLWFGDLPDAWTLAGACVVVASGIYLVHRERVVVAAQSRT